MMPSERLSVRIDAVIRRNLSKEASRVSKSESDLVREALEAFLSKQTSKPSCYDLAKELGIIGSVQRAPSDLSANKKYFRRLEGTNDRQVLIDTGPMVAFREDRYHDTCLAELRNIAPPCSPVGLF
jgi:hypothetical protein